MQHHLRQCLAQWNGSNFKELKQLVAKQTGSTVAFLKDYANSYNISLPRNWKHYLLYSFSLEEQLNKGLLNHYILYQYATCNLESFSKKMYLRTYRIDEEGVVRNIKSMAGVFKKYEIVLVENGDRLFMICNDPSVKDIKDIFGRFDSVPTLAKQHPELPVLSTNIQYREAIDLIRSIHEHSFLPLKIIDYESYLFTELVEPFLYSKDDHLVFLRRTWKKA